MTDHLESNQLKPHSPTEASLIAPRAVLRGPQLVHLGDALLELFVLAFLVGVSLVLAACPTSVSHRCLRSVVSYLALPRQIVLLVAAAVQRYQQVRAAVSVLDGEAGGGHFLARGGCKHGVER